MESLTISAAARHCGVHRRTLQRAIRAGRLRLTPEAQLTIEALTQAGYTAAAPHEASHLDAADTPHDTALGPQVTPHHIERLTEAIEALTSTVDALRSQLTTQRRRTRHAAATRRSDTPQPPPPAFDQARHRLGRLCPRGHDWQGTGQSLRVKNKAGYCLACNAAAVRARRQARRP